MSLLVSKTEWITNKIFSSVNWLFIHKIAARILFAALIVYWYLDLSLSIVPERRFLTKNLLYTGTLLAILYSGLWLSTIKFGSKYRLLVSVLLLPALFGSLIFRHTHDAICSIVAVCVILWSYYIIFKRKRLY